MLTGRSVGGRRQTSVTPRTPRAAISSGIPLWRVVVTTRSGSSASRAAATADRSSIDWSALRRVDVAGLAALLAGADVVVCNNSGGMHLADAVGAPVVVLFSGTEQLELYGPRDVPSVVLRVPTACSSCRRFVCPFGLSCLDVRPAPVVAEALRIAGARSAFAGRASG